MSRLASRLAALGLLLVVVAALVLGVALPLAAHRVALGAEAEALEAQLARFAARLSGATGPVRLVVDEPALLEAASVPRAAAALQARLSESVAEAGGELRRIRAGRAVPVDATGRDAAAAAEAVALRLAVEVEFETTVAGMRSFLHDIEAQAPYLVVESLEARRLSRGRDDEAEAPRIALRIEVAGFMGPPGDA